MNRPQKKAGAHESPLWAKLEWLKKARARGQTWTSIRDDLREKHDINLSLSTICGFVTEVATVPRAPKLGPSTLVEMHAGLEPDADCWIRESGHYTHLIVGGPNRREIIARIRDMLTGGIRERKYDSIERPATPLTSTVDLKA